MINNEFYNTVNSIMATALGIEEPSFTYESFIDYGKQLSELTGADLANNFLSPLMNRISNEIDTFRNYRDKFSGIKTIGGMGIVQIITHSFYESKEAKFANLVDGQHYPFDVYHAPNIRADYYTYSNAFDFELSRSTTELRAAFVSPEAMDSFITSLTGDLWNSINFATESVSRNHVCASILKALDTEPITTFDGYGRRYDLVSIFNSYYDESVSAETALSNPKFVAFTARFIKNVANRMTDRTTKFNDNGVDSFVNGDGQLKTYLLAELKTAIEVSVVNAFNPEGLNIKGEAVNFWQNPDTPKLVGEDGTVSDIPVIATMFDEYHIIKQVELEAMDTSYNPKARFLTDYVHAQYKYLINSNANRVVFTLN